MAGFTPQELEEMARADAEIDAAFEEWVEPEPRVRISDLVWVCRLARRSRTTYGKFVAAHTQEEIQAMIQQEQEGDTYEISI